MHLVGLSFSGSEVCVFVVRVLVTPKTIPFYLSCKQRNSIDLSTVSILAQNSNRAFNT